MRRPFLAPMLAALVALAGLVGDAQAQLSSGVIFAFGPGKIVAETNIPTRVHGDVVVSFRGDPAAGCATYGVCAYSGTIVARPQGGELAIVTTRRRGRIGHLALFALGSPQTGYTTSARVQRSGPGGEVATCADASSAFFGGIADLAGGRSLTLRVFAPGGSVLATRCAGPIDGDLTGVSPAVTIPATRALRGHTVLDFSGTRTFSAHGFAGTIDSTLTISLGKPAPQSLSPPYPAGIKTQRMRIVTERLRLIRVNGRLTVGVRGTDDPIVCRLLDSCGLTGTLSLGSAVHEASAEVIATGPAKRSDADFLAALNGIHVHGISVSVSVSWNADVSADVTQSSAACTDMAGTGGLYVSFASGAIRLGGSGGFAGSWRTRCPGPILESGLGGLSASLAAGALGQRQFTIGLRAAGAFTDDGYVVAPQGRLLVVLRRGTITQQVVTQPAS